MANSVSLKRWEIVPYKAVGPLYFGLTRDQGRSLLGEKFSSFRKGPYSATDTDAYDECGLHLYYDEKDRLEAIEAFEPCPVYYRDISLLNISVREVLDRLASLGVSARYDDGHLLDAGGFALYAPDDVVRAVTVYRKGYYDEPPDVTSNG